MLEALKCMSVKQKSFLKSKQKQAPDLNLALNEAQTHKQEGRLGRCVIKNVSKLHHHHVKVEIIWSSLKKVKRLDTQILTRNRLTTAGLYDIIVSDL